MTTSIRAMGPFLLVLSSFVPLAVAGQGTHLAQASSKDTLPGQIVVDPDHPQWLQRHGGKHVFICGPGDPEDFLYVGRRNPDGTRDGDQLARIAKLAEHGGNCIYMQMVRSHGGDAKGNGDPQWARQNPFVDGDPAQGLDDDILQQWEQWFTVMDRHEILIYLFFYDDGARIWNTGDVVGPQEQAFVAAIVKRFMHHRNLIWVVGEESEERYTTPRVQAIAKIIQRVDQHRHVIGNHHLSGTTFKAWQPEGALNHFAMQLSATDDAAHAGAIEALQRAAGRYQVIYAESTAMRTDVDGMRSHAWFVAMAGMMPMLLRMDIANTPIEALQQCRYLQQFFETTDFWTMSSHDGLKYEGTKYVLAHPGHSYIAYADHLAGRLGIKELPAGSYTATWVDCRTGQRALVELTLSASGDHAFDKPREIGSECAVWLRRHVSASSQEEGQSAREDQPPAQGASTANRVPAVKDNQVTTPAGQPVFIQLSFGDEDGPGPYVYTILRAPVHGVLSGDDNDRFYSPEPGFTGTDEFAWKVSDGQADSKPATVSIHVGAASPSRPRLLVLTDVGGDPDDQQSLIRLMVHANEFEIEGLIATASGTPGELQERRTQPDLIREIVTAYGQVQPRLAEHATGFPPAAELLARVKSGNPHRGREAVGDAHDTEGSHWIIACADRPDPRPLNIVIWGGQTDLAQALWRVRYDRGPEGLRQFQTRLRIYDIADQDGIFEWMWQEFPGMFYVLGQAPPGQDKRLGVFRGMYLGGDESLTSQAWIEEHIRRNHGALGALYPPKTWTAPNPHGALKEGDTPSWLFFLPNGLGDPAHPEWGGWGGRFRQTEAGIWRDAQDTLGGKADARLTVSRWRPAFQNEFAARMDWCVKPRAEANHAPLAVLNDDTTTSVLVLRAAPGERVTLSAKGSSDPDAQPITFRWFVYPEAGSYCGAISLSHTTGETTEFLAPLVQQTETVHAILQVEDTGQPPLFAYRRAIVTLGLTRFQEEPL